MAAAGSLATAFGITGWSDDEADRAALACFRAWLERRGSAGDHDIEAGIRQVVAYIEAHGSSRFEAAWEATTEGVINRAGFRRCDEKKLSRPPAVYSIMVCCRSSATKPMYCAWSSMRTAQNGIQPKPDSSTAKRRRG